MKQKTPLLRKSGVQTLLSSLLCIVLGLLVGYLALLIIEPSGAWDAIVGVLKNFMKYPSAAARIKYFGNTLVKTAPLLLCSLSVLFAYKVGLFNIGAAGQYVIGAAAALYCALMPGLPWYVCLLAAITAAALSGAICGALRAYCNVNVVISGIMLNWISLYATNLILKPGMDPTGKDTYRLIKLGHTDSILPTLGMDELCILCAEGRKREFLADPKFLAYKGFRVADRSDCGINLMYLPMEPTAQMPKFRKCAKHPAIEETGFVLYYTDQCPYTYYWVPRVQEVAKEHGIQFKVIHITDKASAQNVPAPVTTYALFRDGQFLTQSIQSDKKFLALAGL